MIIGIDISQICFTGTGVGRFVEEMVRAVIKKGSAHSYVLFGASLHNRNAFASFYESLNAEEKQHTQLKTIPLPPKALDVLWNILHIFPVEWFIGPVDIFWSSDWTQPPLTQARGVTTIHDLTPRRFPATFAKQIVTVHERKLRQSVKECSFFFCDSEATKQDAEHYLHIPEKKLGVIYPGY